MASPVYADGTGSPILRKLPIRDVSAQPARSRQYYTPLPMEQQTPVQLTVQSEERSRYEIGMIIVMSLMLLAIILIGSVLRQLVCINATALVFMSAVPKP